MKPKLLKLLLLCLIMSSVLGGICETLVGNDDLKPPVARQADLNDEVRKFVKENFGNADPAVLLDPEPSRRMGRMTALFALRERLKMDGTRFAEQLFLATLDYPDNEGAMLSVYFVNATTNSVLVQNDIRWLPAIAPYLETDKNPDARVRARAEIALRYSQVLGAGPLSTESLREIQGLPLVEQYLQTHAPEEHAHLIYLCLSNEPTAAMRSLIHLVADMQTRRQLLRDVLEIRALQAARDYAATIPGPEGTERRVAAEKNLQGRLNALSGSPQWCMRAYVAALFIDTPFKKDRPLLEKLAGDQHPVVAHVAKLVLKEHAAFQNGTTTAPATRPSDRP